MPVSFDEILSQQRDADKAKGGVSENQTVEPLPKRKPAPEDEEEVISVAEKSSSEEIIQNEDVDSVSDEVQAEYRDSTELEPQISPGGGKSNPSRSKKKRVVGDSVQIRDFPRELMSIVRAEFPAANNNTDALAAYVLVKSEKNVNVPDDVKELASTYEGDQSIRNMDQRMKYMEKTIYDLRKQNEQIMLLMSYIAFDRLGYRKEQAKSPRDVNFLESGVGDLMNRLVEQANVKHNQDERAKGRPIR